MSERPHTVGCVFAFAFGRFGWRSLGGAHAALALRGPFNGLSSFSK